MNQSAVIECILNSNHDVTIHNGPIPPQHTSQTIARYVYTLSRWKSAGIRNALNGIEETRRLAHCFTSVKWKWNRKRRPTGQANAHSFSFELFFYEFYHSGHPRTSDSSYLLHIKVFSRPTMFVKNLPTKLECESAVSNRDSDQREHWAVKINYSCLITSGCLVVQHWHF